MVKYFRFLLISLLFVPFIVNAKYVQVNDLNEIKENSKIFFLVDYNVFTFVDILENPTNTEVSIDDGINENEIDYNNIFNVGKIINISGNTMKLKSLLIGDPSVSCKNNKPCGKGYLYLKHDMFHYQSKQIKIENIGNGFFSIKNDDNHYLNYIDNEWIINNKKQGIQIFKLEDEHNNDEIEQEEKLTYITDDILIMGATKLDKEAEVNQSYINIFVHYDFDDIKEYKINYRYNNYDSVDLKIKFVDKYSEDLFVSKYDYLFNSEEYLDSDYLITRIYAKQDSSYSNISNEDLSNKGGLLDNITGKSDLHIYVSSKYSAEYYIGNDLQRNLSMKDKYYISPDSYEIPSGYEEATDYFENSNILLSSNTFLYDMDMSGYDSSFYLPENDLRLPWYLNGKKINGEFIVGDNILEADNKVFKFISYLEVDNPNTYSSFITLFIGMTIICGLILLSRRKLL